MLETYQRRVTLTVGVLIASHVSGQVAVISDMISKIHFLSLKSKYNFPPLTYEHLYFYCQR